MAPIDPETQKAEDCFLQLVTTDREACARWVETNDPPVENFHEKHRRLAGNVYERWEKHQALYTREAANEDAEALPRRERIGYLSAFSGTKFVDTRVKKDNQPTYAAAVNEAARKRATLAAVELIREGKAVEAAEAILSAARPEPPKPQERPPLSFDLSRLPAKLVKGFAGLTRLNPLLSASGQIMVPFAVAGTIIGKRMELDNLCNLYYPNIWTVVIAPTNSNKTGTRNLVLRSLPDHLKLPDSPTCEALIDRIGGTFKKESGEELTLALAAAATASRANLNGGCIVADEVTGTLRKLIGEPMGNGKGEQNLETVLKLATSGESIEQPRTTAGHRAAYDCCVSLIGFTQNDTWQACYGDDKYRSVGLIGRIITCCDGLQFTNMPEADRDDWTAFVAAVSNMGDPFDEADHRDHRNRAVITAENDSIGPVMREIKKTPAWEALRYAVGDYSDSLYGKVIAQGAKLAMVCAWIERTGPAKWLAACCELVACCWANYFTRTAGSTAKLGARDYAALVYIRENPGCTPNQLRRKLSLRDMREVWLIVGTLEEENLIEVREGKRKDSPALFAKRVA